MYLIYFCYLVLCGEFRSFTRAEDGIPVSAVPSDSGAKVKLAADGTLTPS